MFTHQSSAASHLACAGEKLRLGDVSFLLSPVGKCSHNAPNQNGNFQKSMAILLSGVSTQRCWQASWNPYKTSRGNKWEHKKQLSSKVREHTLLEAIHMALLWLSLRTKVSELVSCVNRNTLPFWSCPYVSLALPVCLMLILIVKKKTWGEPWRLGKQWAKYWMTQNKF